MNKMLKAKTAKRSKNSRASEEQRQTQLHSESLLRVPLVHQMMTDPHVKLAERAIDLEWYYTDFLKDRISGFNPSHGKIYYGRKSKTAKWLKKPEGPSRHLNAHDFLTNELFFMVHDYLHEWCYRLISELYPKLHFGTSPITTRNLEENVFCHLVTEAAATVGLDYWFLSQDDLNKFTPIGSAFGPLTTHYREAHVSEIQRSSREFVVNDPSFFKLMAKFYCSGIFPGVSATDLAESPINYQWISHEIEYGQTGRAHTRTWMRLMAGAKDTLSEKMLEAPVKIKHKWQKDLISVVAEYVWEKVKFGKDPHPAPLSQHGKGWKQPKIQKCIDYRFFNVNFFGDNYWDEVLRYEVHPLGKNALFMQIVSKYEYSKMPREVLKLLHKIRDESDLLLLQYLLRDFRPLKTKPGEPRDLFLPN